ncbi:MULTISPECIES: hypothetical protein [unclassified Streptomyces]|uniref:hypothetical protein n=1 Tax=unclassified Streptomyces TaxID=2593676 RepID=UPI00342910CD
MTISPAKRWHRVHERAPMPLLGGVRPPIASLAALLLRQQLQEQRRREGAPPALAERI